MASSSERISPINVTMTCELARSAACIVHGPTTRTVGPWWADPAAGRRRDLRGLRDDLGGDAATCRTPIRAAVRSLRPGARVRPDALGARPRGPGHRALVASLSARHRPAATTQGVRMDRSYITRNDASRAHLERLVDPLTEEQLALVVDGWPIGVHLAHLAFWDRLHAPSVAGDGTVGQARARLGRRSAAGPHQRRPGRPVGCAAPRRAAGARQAGRRRLRCPRGDAAGLARPGRAGRGPGPEPRPVRAPRAPPRTGRSRLGHDRCGLTPSLLVAGPIRHQTKVGTASHTGLGRVKDHTCSRAGHPAMDARL